jgi:mono/diheme cytochrome c family protein
MVIFSLFAVRSAFANPGECPQPRKHTTKANGFLAKKDNNSAEYKRADAKKGKLIYTKKAKPITCKMCHGKFGDGAGKLGKNFIPKPRNFTCTETMKDISAGQMFYVIKNGSEGTSMKAHGRTLNDKEIWDVVKYIRSTWVK